jgi:hypothetical protein
MFLGFPFFPFVGKAREIINRPFFDCLEGWKLSPLIIINKKTKYRHHFPFPWKFPVVGSNHGLSIFFSRKRVNFSLSFLEGKSWD